MPDWEPPLLAICSDKILTSKFWFAVLPFDHPNGGSILDANPCRTSLAGVVGGSPGAFPNWFSFGQARGAIGNSHDGVFGDVFLPVVYNRDNVGEMIKFQAFLTGDTAQGTSFIGVEVECNGDYDPWCDRCHPMANYDFNTVSLTIAGFNVPVKVLEADSRRMSIGITVTSGGSAGNIFGMNMFNDNTSYWFSANQPYQYLFAYRDWGPIIQQPLYMWSNKVGTVITVTSIFRVNQLQ